MSLRIVIPGGSGQIGTFLAKHLMSQGHDVTVLSRNPQPAPWRVVHWDVVTAGDWVSYLEGADVCINLAGRSVNCRYHPANRQQIYDSRILSTRLLNQVIPALSHPPRVWLNASTATIYRHATDRPMDEASGELGGNEPGVPETWNFSIKVARDWESAFFETPSPRTRKIALRSAVTLIAARGGAFDLLSSLVRRGLGGTQGSGAQMVSWMHQADFVRAVDFLIAAEDFSGVANLASPHPLPNREFMHSLRRAWRIPFGLPAPAPLLEMGCWLLNSETELVLKSRYVVPGRLQAAGFQFLYPDWPSAAQDLAARTLRA